MPLTGRRLWGRRHSAQVPQACSGDCGTGAELVAAATVGWGQGSRRATHDDLGKGGHRLIQLCGEARLGLFIGLPYQAGQRVAVGTVGQRAIQGPQPLGDRADPAADALVQCIQPGGQRVESLGDRLQRTRQRLLHTLVNLVQPTS